MAAREAGCDEARGWCQRGGLAKWIINNKQILTVAASDEAGGSWLRRRGRLAAAAREAGCEEAGDWYQRGGGAGCNDSSQ